MKLTKIFIACIAFAVSIAIGYFFPWKPLITGDVSNILTTPLSTTSHKKVIGFLPFWLTDTAKTSYKDYLTTWAYYALIINADGTIQKRVNPVEEEPGWTTFNMQKMQNLHNTAKKEGLETSLLIFTIDEDDIEAIARNPETAANNFLSDIIPILLENGFRDLNMDIESFVKTSRENQIGYATFISLIKSRLNEVDITLTVDITPESLIKPRLTDVKLLEPYVDYFVLMTYDYHYIYSPLSGPVSPVGGSPDLREYDVETAVKIALQTIPAHKLILGIPLYGYEWETIQNKPGSPIIPDSGKTASSRRINEILSSCENCINNVDIQAEQPYIIIPENGYFSQIFYEDETSLSKKLELSKKYKLAGVALWALGYENDTILNPLKFYK